MTDNVIRSQSRRLVRPLVRAGAAGLCLSLVGVGGAGFADTPSAWANSPHVSGLQFLLVLFLIPLALFIVITLLASMPYLLGSGSSKSDIVIHDANEPHLDANQH